LDPFVDAMYRETERQSAQERERKIHRDEEKDRASGWAVDPARIEQMSTFVSLNLRLKDLLGPVTRVKKKKKKKMSTCTYPHS